MTADRAAPRVAFFLATSGHSGVDRVMQRLIPAVAARGYPVDLLRVRGHGPDLGGEVRGVRVVDLGCSHVYACVGRVARYLRRERPTAMLADKDRVNRTALLARALSGVPVRLVLRSGTTISVDLASRGALDRRVQAASMRYLYGRAFRVLVPSLGAARDLSAYAGLPPSHIAVVPSPIVTDDLVQLAESPLDDDWLASGQPPVILGVGELSGRKDYATLVNAFAIVRKEMPCRLLILGEGRQRENLERLAAELGVAADVRLPGFSTNPYAYMRRAGAFVHTSRWEGMPVVLIEALALGVPVVATDCPSGPRELLQDGRVAPLVPVGDCRAVAAAILEVLRKPPDAQALRQAAEPYRVGASVDAYLAAMGLEAAP